MKFTLIGSAAAPGIPCYGCYCDACAIARNDLTQQRVKTSAMLEHDGRRLLFDANAENFLTLFPHGSFDAICLTHFHMDHVSALFDIRWGMGKKIPVFHLDDKNGADDLFRHSGILNFKPIRTFVTMNWQHATITPVPMNHSRPTLGYVVDVDNNRFCMDTTIYLIVFGEQTNYPTFLDTSPPPQTKPPRNHHNVIQAKQLFELLKPHNMGLIHITHNVLDWALANPDFFNEHFYLAHDGDCVLLTQ